jgi:hypothetical protein
MADEVGKRFQPVSSALSLFNGGSLIYRLFLHPQRFTSMSAFLSIYNCSTKEQITYILRQVEAKSSALEACRKFSIIEQIFYRLKKSLSAWASLSFAVLTTSKRKTSSSSNWLPMAQQSQK